MNQPQPAPGDIVTATGLWTEAGLLALSAIAAEMVAYKKGPLGWSAYQNRVQVGRIHVPPAGGGKVYSVRVEGHQFWAPPSPVIPKWHYSPVASRPSLAQAKALIHTVLAARPSAFISTT